MTVTSQDSKSVVAFPSRFTFALYTCMHSCQEEMFPVVFSRLSVSIAPFSCQTQTTGLTQACLKILTGCLESIVAGQCFSRLRLSFVITDEPVLSVTCDDIVFFAAFLM